MNAVGERRDVPVAKHARGNLGIEVGDSVHARDQSDGEVGHGAPPPLLRVASVSDELLCVIGQQFPDNLLNQLPCKSVMAGRNRRVGREQRALFEFLSTPALAEHLQHRKRAVPLVQMQTCDIMAKLLEGANAANPEQVLLTHPHAVIAAV